MLAYSFIDPSNSKGVDTFNEILSSLAISFDEFKGFLLNLPTNENTRFSVYKDISLLSSDDKGTIRSILYNAYSNGGKQGTDYAIFYFKEMITNCDLANAYIHL